MMKKIMLAIMLVTIASFLGILFAIIMADFFDMPNDLVADIASGALIVLALYAIWKWDREKKRNKQLEEENQYLRSKIKEITGMI